MDVHDVGTTREIHPGMAFVIEPGIYIRESALEHLPPTPENAAFISKVRPLVQKYGDMGVRVEDSFLLTAEGLERISRTVPRTIAEIEEFMKGSRPPVTSPAARPRGAPSGARPALHLLPAAPPPAAAPSSHRPAS